MRLIALHRGAVQGRQGATNRNWERTTGINETQLFIRDSDLQGLSREEAVPGGGRPGRDLEFGPGSGGGMMVIASIQKAI